jgi:dCMP deaminase
MRLNRDQFLMQAARLASLRSTCNRLHVGAVLSKDGRIISSGYNGAPARLAHCSLETCYEGGPPCTNAVHAEANCIAFAARYGISTEGATLFSTDSPCMECAKLIINAGIKNIFYDRDYRLQEPLFTLDKAGVCVRRLGDP